MSEITKEEDSPLRKEADTKEEKEREDIQYIQVGILRQRGESREKWLLALSPNNKSQEQERNMGHWDPVYLGKRRRMSLANMCKCALLKQLNIYLPLK